tara:strand:+ start:59 stop:622 length:564 start_codon:yes stop_codon:yes gene_type:complete
MSKSSENVKRWRRKTKERLVKAFGGVCACCEINGPSCIMDFHHLDPDEKEFGFGAIRANIKSWGKIAKEVRKCVMLCANCHRKHHAGLLNIPPEARRFDESYANYKDLERQEKKDSCPICGKEKSIHNITCSRTCAGKKSRKVDWEKYDKVLREEVRKKTSWIKISEKIGNISDVGVRKRASKLKLI